MRDLGLVANVAAICMVVVMFFGAWYDALTHVNKVQHVPCSVSLVDRANKFHVTLLDECVLER